MIRLSTHALAVVFLLAAATAKSETPLGTDLIYQGNLSSPGMPAVTTADFQFTLHDALNDGALVGAMVPKDNVAIINGVFALSLDFGATAFSGNARWLQVAVRSPAGTGNFTTLTPRQPITSTPHSTYSLQTRGLVVDDSGRVGIGVSPAPAFNTKLEVGGNVIVPSNSGFFVRNAGGTANAAGFVADINQDLSLIAGGTPQMYLDADGRVGVGEVHPFGKLHVKTSSSGAPALALEGPGNATLQFYPQGQGNILTSGDIGFPVNNNSTLFIRNFDPAGKIAFTGVEGTRFPATGKEDLRIIRGFVIGDGTVDYGTGFTVNRIEEGRYVINFDTPFAEFPVATANTVSVGFSSCFIEFSGIGPASIGLHVVRRSDGDLVDGHFYFIAIGPR